SRQDQVVYVFKGFAEDSQVCDFMLVYLVDTCNRLYNRDKARLGLKGISDKNDYLLGLVKGLGERMDEMIAERESAKASDRRSLVVLKKAMVEEEFGEAKYRKTRRYRAAGAGYEAGKKAEKNVDLDSFVGNSNKAHANNA